MRKDPTRKQTRHATRAHEPNQQLKRTLESIKHDKEGDPPRRSDCTALLPLASKVAIMYEPCSIVIQQIELMKGLGDIYDIRPGRKESLVDWLTKVLFRLKWCDLVFQDDDGVIAVLEFSE